MVIHEIAPCSTQPDKEADEPQPARPKGNGCAIHGEQSARKSSLHQEKDTLNATSARGTNLMGAVSGAGSEHDSVSDPAGEHAGHSNDPGITCRGSGPRQQCAHEKSEQKQLHNGASDTTGDGQATHGRAANELWEAANPCEPLPLLVAYATSPERDTVAREAECTKELNQRGRKRPRHATCTSGVQKRTATASKGGREPVGGNPKPVDPNPCKAVTPPGGRTNNGRKRKVETAQPHGNDHHRRPRTNCTGPKVPELDTSHQHRCAIAADQGKGELVGYNPTPSNPLPFSAVYAKHKRKAQDPRKQEDTSSWVAKAQKTKTGTVESYAVVTTQEEACDVASVTQDVKATQREPHTEESPSQHRKNTDGRPGRITRCGATETRLVNATGCAKKPFKCGPTAGGRASKPQQR